MVIPTKEMPMRGAVFHDARGLDAADPGKVASDERRAIKVGLQP
jgi:hypothetical protein